MKKLFSIILTVCMILSVCTLPAFAESTIKVTVDGKLVDCAAYGQEPVAVEGRTLVPLRSVFEALGATVHWDGDTQSVVSTRDDDMIVLKLNSADMIVNNQVKVLDVPAQVMNERTMVPVRAIAEAFGCDVGWDGATMTVIVSTTAGEETPDKVVSSMYDSMISLDLETGISYFQDANAATAYFGASSTEEYIITVAGVDSSDERMYKIVLDGLTTCLGSCTYTIDTVTVKDDTAVVTTTVSIPNFENMNADVFPNMTDEQSEILLTKALEKCGVTLEEMLATSDPVLQLDFEYAVIEVSFEYATELILQEVANGNVETKNETITLEKIDGKWIITEIN